MNPAKDGLVRHPSEYRWSSYSDYIGKRNLPIINKELLLSTFGDQKNFIEQTLILNVKDAP